MVLFNVVEVYLIKKKKKRKKENTQTHPRNCDLRCALGTVIRFDFHVMDWLCIKIKSCRSRLEGEGIADHLCHCKSIMLNKKLLKNESEPSKFGTNFINNLINIRYQGEFTTVNYIIETKAAASALWLMDPQMNSAVIRRAINKILTTSTDDRPRNDLH